MKKLYVNGREIEFTSNDLKVSSEKFLIIKKSELVKFLDSDKEVNDNRFVVIAADYLGKESVSKCLGDPIIVDSVNISSKRFRMAAFNIESSDD